MHSIFLPEQNLLYALLPATKYSPHIWKCLRFEMIPE